MSEQEQKTKPSALTAKIEVWIAAILMVVAFGVGFVMRGFTAQESTTTPGIEQTVPGTTSGVVQAPALTDQQLQQGLPQGHPTFTGGGTGGTGATSTDPDGDGDNDTNNKPGTDKDNG
jgi:hypothetical protein